MNDVFTSENILPREFADWESALAELDRTRRLLEAAELALRDASRTKIQWGYDLDAKQHGYYVRRGRETIFAGTKIRNALAILAGLPVEP